MHNGLVEHAVKYLRKARGCSVVLAEARTRHAEESPDAIGWHRDGRSILIECKVNRKDFLDEWSRTDRKLFRKEPDSGMGCERYYLTFPGVIQVNELAPTGWGLIILQYGILYTIGKSAEFKSNRDSELKLLVKAISTTPREKESPQLRFRFAERR